MVLSCFVYTTRLPYQFITEATGYFKETRNSAIWEIVINIAISLICAPWMGLNGILVGSLVGGLVRVVNLIWICCRKILKISLIPVIKNYVLYCGGSFFLVFFVAKAIPINPSNYLTWVLYAIPVTLGVLAIILSVSVVFNRRQLMGIIKFVIKRK